jgi:hypothetical protein
VDFTAVTMNNAVFWDLTPCGSYKNGCFGGMYHLHHEGGKNKQARNVSKLAAKAVCFREVISSSETSVLTRGTQRKILEDSILQDLRCCFLCGSCRIRENRRLVLPRPSCDSGTSQCTYLREHD